MLFEPAPCALVEALVEALVLPDKAAAYARQGREGRVSPIDILLCGCDSGNHRICKLHSGALATGRTKASLAMPFSAGLFPHVLT